MPLAHLIVSLGSLYLKVGVAVSLLFAFGLVSRVEPSAAGGSALFRLLIVPGAALLWPVIVLRSARALRRSS